MAIRRKDGKYQCMYCQKIFPSYQLADQCRDSHDLIYIAISKEDLNRLNLFIRTHEDELLTETLIRSIAFNRRNI